MIFLSAGHHNADPGAIGNGYREADLARELRELTVAEIKRIGGSVIVDKDYETLGQYISRIRPGSGSVLCELHFNASVDPSDSGSECLYPESGGLESRELAGIISKTLSLSMGINNRGAKSERKSARGSLAILRTAAGISVLPEICFISNANDMRSYQQKKYQIAAALAHLLVSFDHKKS